MSTVRTALFLLLLLPALLPAGEDGVAFFERHIRPLLADKCFSCHDGSAGKSKGGLTLDTRAGWQQGGDSGPAIVPGKPEASLLLKALSWEDADLRMPPAKSGGKLSAANLALVRQWIAMGAPDPRDGANRKLSGLSDTARAHWAYQPVRQPAVPTVRTAGWVRSPIDAFVLRALEQKNLTPSAPASKEALIRRATYDLIGLPPTLDDVRAFLADQSPDAFARVVDRLLASPHYGERWGRHWLDTVRYSDTKGLMSMGGKNRYEDYRFPSAWTYRDYVVRAFNDDKPYDRFLVEQLAADQLPDLKPGDPRLAALGFITVGKRFDSEDDLIDERIDTVGRGMLGLTLACARCHDHKFDPVPTADYYSLHGVFRNLREPYTLPELPARGTPAEQRDYEQSLRELEERNRGLLYDLLRDRLAQFHAHSAGWLMMTSKPYQSTERFDTGKRYGLSESPEICFAITRGPLSDHHPVLGPFSRLAKLPATDFATKAPTVLASALDGKQPVNPLVAAALRDARPRTLDEVAEIYAGLFTRAAAAGADHFAALAKPGVRSPVAPELIELLNVPYRLPPADEVMTTEQQMTYYQQLPLQGRTVRTFLFDDINLLRLTHPGAPGWAMVVQDPPKPSDSPIYLRGDRHKTGAVVPRRFLEILSRGERKPFTRGSGRLDLAQAIADRANPLTARVALNRIWMHHFGEGFVRTPDDLGTMSEAPSHPELLDWLTARFIADGWSFKKMHRLIMLSATYQQAVSTNVDGERSDPENRLLWRANLRRLDFEAIRDSLVLLTGRMDRTIGGQPVNITDEPLSYRRTLYGYIDRLNLSDLMTQFDFSDPDQPNTRRISTIVPQQALFFLNSPMAIDAARQVIARRDVAEVRDATDRIRVLYRILFQREPLTKEVMLARAFLDQADRTPAKAAGNQPPRKPAAPPRAARDDKYSPLTNPGEAVSRAPLTSWERLVHLLLCRNEFVYVS